MSFRLVHWTAKWPLFCVMLPNLVVSGRHCVKLVDNLRLLCLVVNVCRGNVGRPRYTYSITARWKFCCRFINSRLNAQYLPIAIVLIGSRIWALDWYQNRWPWVTLNVEMALILRYFTEFDNGPYFLLFHRIRARYRRITIIVRLKTQLNKPPRKVAHKRKEAHKSLIISPILKITIKSLFKCW